MNFFSKVKAFFASLFHAEEDALQPIVTASVAEALAEAPGVVQTALTGGDALKVAGAALTKIGNTALAQDITVSTNTAMVLVSHELGQQAPAK